MPEMIDRDHVLTLGEWMDLTEQLAHTLSERYHAEIIKLRERVTQLESPESKKTVFDDTVDLMVARAQDDDDNGSRLDDAIHEWMNGEPE